MVINICVRPTCGVINNTWPTKYSDMRDLYSKCCQRRLWHQLAFIASCDFRSKTMF